MILPENTPKTGQKRPADVNEPVAAPSKKARKSQNDSEKRAYKRVHEFIMDGEIQLKDESLHAYDCGGEVYQECGGSVTELLIEFGVWLDEVDGDYHQHMGY